MKNVNIKHDQDFSELGWLKKTVPDCSVSTTNTEQSATAEIGILKDQNRGPPVTSTMPLSRRNSLDLRVSPEFEYRLCHMLTQEGYSAPARHLPSRCQPGIFPLLEVECGHVVSFSADQVKGNACFAVFSSPFVHQESDFQTRAARPAWGAE